MPRFTGSLVLPTYWMTETPLEEGSLIFDPTTKGLFWFTGDDFASPVPQGGTNGQVLAKKTATDFDTEWVAQTGGGGGGTVPIEAWKTIGADGGATAFLGVFSALAGFTPQYRKRPDGVVELRGMVKVSTNTTSGIMFTLPAGYRPDVTQAEWYLPISVHTGAGYVDGDAIAFTNGNVNLARVTSAITSGGWISLYGIRFPTDQTTFPTGPQGPSGDSGVVSVQYPAFAAYAPAQIDNRPVSSYNAIPLTGESFDTHGWYDAPSGRFVPKVAGYYRLSFDISCYRVTSGSVVFTAGTRMIPGLLKNGSTFHFGIVAYANGSGDDYSVGGSWTVYANGTTDYFEIAAHVNAAGPWSVRAGADRTHFHGELVQPSGGAMTNPHPVIVDALPAIPVDGQEVYLQNTGMANLNIIWHLRYRLATARWEFLGGAKWRIRSTGPYTASAANNWEALPTGLMTRFTTPQAGLYRFLWGARFQAQITTTTEAYLGIAISTSPGSPLEYIRQNLATGSGGVSYIHEMMEHDTALQAGIVITLVANTQTAVGNMVYAVPWLQVEPVYLTG